MEKNRPNGLRVLLRFLQGMLIGVGAVLPGISGGVLCVVFGIYKPVMELLGDPLHKFRTHVPKLLPVIVGGAAGFLGVAKILAFFLEAYPDPSVCLFIGLITGMLPSLFREACEQGRPKGCGAALGIATHAFRAVSPYESAVCFALLIVGAIPEWLDLISHRTERIRFMRKEERRVAQSAKPE